MYEVRWFFEGTLPSEVHAWLNSLRGMPEAQPTRPEVYLRWGEQIGLKISRGNLELKYCPTPGEPFTLAGGWSGSIETWTRSEWQYRPKDQSDPDPVFDQFANNAFAGIRFRTQKNRILLKFDATQEELLPIKPKDIAPEAFLVELGGLTVMDHGTWWFVQFELVGDERTAKDALKKRMAWALGQGWPGGLPLRQADSMGYPRFFERLVGRDLG